MIFPMDEFQKIWHEDTFLMGAFNDERDFDEYLDDPETGEGDWVFDTYQKEINDYLFG